MRNSLGTTKRHQISPLRTITALILREMSTRYGRTPGGYIWSILEPLAAIIFLSVGFSLVMRTPSLGTSFIIFYTSGYLPFNLYQTLSNTVARSLMFSRPLLRYPAVSWVDAILARFFLNSLTGLMVAFLLITGTMLTVENQSTLDIPQILFALGLAMLLGLGVGCFNAAVAGLFPIWEVTWAIITRPLFLASGIFYIYEDLPTLARDILWYNPLIHITGLMRTGFYPTYSASYVSLTFVLLVGMSLTAIGLLLVRRYHKNILTR